MDHYAIQKNSNMHTKHKPDNTNQHSIKTMIHPHRKGCPYKPRLISATTLQISLSHGADTWYPQSPKEILSSLSNLDRIQYLSSSESLPRGYFPCAARRLECV